MPPQRQGEQNFLGRLVSFARGITQINVAETQEGIRAATGIKKMIPVIIGVIVVLIVVTLGKW